MSATLRYDIGRSIYQLIELEFPGVLATVNCREVSRWAGWYRAAQGQRNECWTFSIRLPGEIAEGWKLLRAVSWLQCRLPSDYDGVWRFPLIPLALTGCHLLQAKLTISLGLPVYYTYPGDERAFLSAIEQNPGDITTWLVYADWLEENPEEEEEPPTLAMTRTERAGIIRAWAARKPAVKMKYGVPAGFYARYKKVPSIDTLGFLDSFTVSTKVDGK